MELWNAEQIVGRAREAKSTFGVKCGKFSGAVTVELLRAALASQNVVTSNRDVFIEGIPLEIDLVVPRLGEKPSLELLYRPQQVAVALEVKNSGSFGEDSIRKVRHDFELLQNAGIECAYITFEERRSFRWQATHDRLNAECFTLAWHKATGGPIEPTEDWTLLLKFLRKCLQE